MEHEVEDMVSQEELNKRDMTAPAVDPTVSWLRRNPVILFALMLFLPTLGAAVTAWSEGHTVVAIIASGTTALIAAATPYVYKAVTPVADPKDNSGNRLVVER